MTIKLTHVFLLILFLTASRLQAQTYNIVDFGAKTDSTFLNTSIIQKAVDVCFRGVRSPIFIRVGKSMGSGCVVSSLTIKNWRTTQLILASRIVGKWPFWMIEY